VQDKELIGLYWQTAKKMVTYIHRRKREDRIQSESIRSVNR
jgi:hypothetical protein